MQNPFKKKSRLTEQQIDELRMITSNGEGHKYIHALQYFDNCATDLGTNNFQCGIVVGLYLAKMDREYAEGLTEYVRRGQAIVNNNPGQDGLEMMVRIMLNNKDITCS